MATYWTDGTELYHHGIIGMKWGRRRFQNPDGTYTEEGRRRYGVGIQKLEKKAIADNYKQYKKNGGSSIVKQYRTSTGKNYDKANKNFGAYVEKDKKYDELSKKAFEAEKKRLMYEKSYVDDDDAYDKMINSKEYKELDEASAKAKRAKDARLNELAESYVDTIKEAKLNDLNIRENRDIAKAYVSGKFDAFYSDDNLEYNVDNYYDKWVDKQTYKSKLSNQNNKTATERFKAAQKDNPKLTWNHIYKEMGVDMDSEDEDDYKEAENAWFKKHGY